MPLAPEPTSRTSSTSASNSIDEHGGPREEEFTGRSELTLRACAFEQGDTEVLLELLNALRQ